MGKVFWAAFEKGTADTIALHAHRERVCVYVFESIEHSMANGQNSNQQWGAPEHFSTWITCFRVALVILFSILAAIGM